MPVNLQPADAPAVSTRQHLDLVTLAERARDQRPGHDRPETLEHERAIHRKARNATRALRRDLVDQPGQRRAQRFEPVAGACRNFEHVGRGEERPLEKLPDLERDDLAQLGVDQIALGQRDEAAPEAEQTADLQMLTGLRLHAPGPRRRRGAPPRFRSRPRPCVARTARGRARRRTKRRARRRAADRRSRARW